MQNIINTPVKNLPEANRETGMWVEVSLPYFDMVMDNPPPRSPGLQDRQKLGLPPRLYYSQILWVDQIKTDEQGQVWYRINERYGRYGDILWGAAEAFRHLTTNEIEPISPDIEDKNVVVDITNQILSCFEGKTEVYYTRISSGVGIGR
ncbi:MAG TPA: hypothetical protein VLD65_00440 [Anaerolineales bacterium]|nr:hypothetical protein [Anaerolineales bacterium]